MTEKPTIGGYEFSMTCACGGDISATGMDRTGPPPERELATFDRNSQSITEGEYECDWCGKVWELSFDVVEEKE